MLPNRLRTVSYTHLDVYKRQELMGVFSAFQEANDARLVEIEKKVVADVLLEEKVDRLDKALSHAQASLDKIALINARSPAATEAKSVSELKQAWSQYMRRGDEAALNRIEAKSLSVGVNSDGGYVAPPEIQATIDRILFAISPMRRLASVRPTSAIVFKKPMSISIAQAGWVAESGARTATNTPSLDLVSFPIGELYASAAATQTILDDALVDMDSWLAGEIAQSFAIAEGTAFISGDGVNKPKGILAYTIAAEGSQTYGQMGYVATGVAGGFAATNPIDKLVDLTSVSYTHLDVYKRQKPALIMR